MNAVRGPTAYAVGYLLAPLRGSSNPRVFRLTVSESTRPHFRFIPAFSRLPGYNGRL
jgi:hypothetical protein